SDPGGLSQPATTRLSVAAEMDSGAEGVLVIVAAAGTGRPGPPWWSPASAVAWSNSGRRPGSAPPVGVCLVHLRGLDLVPRSSGRARSSHGHARGAPALDRR